MYKDIKNINVVDPTIVESKYNSMKNTAKQYTSKDSIWQDESGVSIPFNRTTKVERLMERSSMRILKSALTINKKLVEFKDLVRDLSNKAYEAFMDEKNTNRRTKGNFTWYNFDRSIKIEVAISEPITFDDLTIQAAKAKFDEFLDENIESKNDYVKEMVTNAFETQRSGKMDVKEVMKLSRFEPKVNDTLFSEAVSLINQAIRRPKSKTYFRVWMKNENGEYQNVDLNLSSL